MNARTMQRVQYTGEIWAGLAVHPDLWQLLLEENTLVVITGGASSFDVILGVPHHAPPGVERIAQAWVNPRTGEPGRPADECAGLSGLAVYSTLREKGLSCKLVIAAQAADHDPNKTPGSPYWESIFVPPLPRLLFELHGAASHRRHAIELSAGRNPASNPELFGKILAFFFTNSAILACQTSPGAADARLYKNGQRTAGRLQNPALETLSLTHAGELGIPALHLEMKNIYRQPDPQFQDAPRPTPAAWQLARALAETIRLLSQPDDIIISGASLGLPITAFLTRPAMEYQESYLAAVRETPVHEMNDNPELRIFSPADFTSLVQGTHQVSYEGLPEHPPEEYLWLIDQGEFIGRVFFLHWLNDFRRQTDGQVDYWIRPSRRRQGYGRLILRLLLERYRQLGEERVLISCLASNHPSERIIEANGGVLEGVFDVPDWAGFPRPRKRFWIDLRAAEA